jgi:hypothetical protein
LLTPVRAQPGRTEPLHRTFSPVRRSLSSRSARRRISSAAADMVSVFARAPPPIAKIARLVLHKYMRIDYAPLAANCVKRPPRGFGGRLIAAELSKPCDIDAMEL